LNGAAMGSETIDFNADDVTPTNTGQAICVIDPDAFGEGADFKRKVDQLIREMRGSARMPGVDRIWLPGEQSHEKRARSEREGIALPPALRSSLETFAREMGVTPL
jgi:LDH2 family malate/lactate/ureidoglycolate dehydrogenase